MQAAAHTFRCLDVNFNLAASLKGGEPQFECFWAYKPTPVELARAGCEYPKDSQSLSGVIGPAIRHFEVNVSGNFGATRGNFPFSFAIIREIEKQITDRFGTSGVVGFHDELKALF